jgi:protein phosphatase
VSTWPRALHFRAAAATARGHGRLESEDDCAVLEERGVLAVAGGGHPGGATPAALAVDTVREVIGTGAAWDRERVRLELRAAFDLANMEVRSAALRDRRAMITALVVARALPDQLWIAHVGDSRALLVRDGQIRRLTTDHVVAYDPSVTARGGQQGLLTRAIGLGERIDPELCCEAVRPGDAILLATSGLTSLLSEGEIARAMTRVRRPDATVQCLVRWALDRGWWDDITVAVGVWAGLRPV